MIGLGLLDYTRSKEVIVVGSFILQAIGGVGNGVMIPATMALLSSYKEHRAQFIGYFELIAGLGALVGPLLGSSLYQGMGYKGPFLGLGVIYLVPVLIFAPRIKNLEAKQMVQNEENSSVFTRRLNFCEICNSTRAAFGFIG